MTAQGAGDLSCGMTAAEFVARPQTGRCQPAWRIFAASGELFAALDTYVAEISSRSISERGQFSIVLTGGNTVVPLYRRLCHLDTDWGAWRIFWSDERCVPADDDFRNSKMAYTEWLDHVPISSSRVYVIPAEQGPNAAARSYGEVLANEDIFDLVLLSLGEDGHIASLFNGRPLGDEPGAPDVLAVWNAPKAPACRVSMGARRLSACRHLMVVATGVTKQPAVKGWQNGEDLPVAHLSSAMSVNAWVDEAAWPPVMHNDL